MKDAGNPASSSIFVIGLKLCLICAVSAVSLGALNVFTEQAIEDQKIKEEEQTLEVLVPPGMTAEEKVFLKEPGVVQGFYTLIKGGRKAAYILDLKGSGYGGDMKMLTAYQLDGSIIAARLLDNLETPGLGKKAESESYMRRFAGTGGSQNPVPVSKEMLAVTSAARTSAVPAAAGTRQGAKKRLSFGVWFLGDPSAADADSVSGATITFLGVAEALAGGAEYVREKRGGE